MNVQTFFREGFQHRRLQNAHEAGENHEFNSRITKYSHKLHFGLQIESGSKSSAWQISVRNRKFPRDVKDRRLQHVRDHHACLRRQFTIFNSLENCATIRSFARAEYSERQQLHLEMLLNFSSSREVEYPFSNGTIRISAP